LLLSQTGCLLSQLRTTDTSRPTVTQLDSNAQSTGMEKEKREPAQTELILTAAQTPGTLPPPMQPQKPKVDQLPPPQGPSPPKAHLGFTTPTLTLRDLVELAVQNHPDLAIAQARVEMARGQMVQAGLYPNPRVWMDLDALGTRGHGWGDPGAMINQ